MPSFDVVSEVDKHEAQNAVDQANRELSTRFDFRGVSASFELKDFVVTMIADNNTQLDQMKSMLISAMIKRSIKANCLEFSDPQGTGKQVKILATMRQGIDKDLGRKIAKLIKDSKIKVQASIQGDTVRVQGKKRDDLQQVMAMLRGEESIDMPLAFKNFKD
ncbi:MULTISPECIES: YajQ family cyclic di-GMP-binding protein [Thalassolituus]|uniref:Nucleotide-binding protein SAMN05421686_104303 n=1 Tax=Thalassolituus maritimus TaxID=484498 RepID=A0A1N7LYN0_9GAMM|nr:MULTISPECIES: YajQ family cyclic di-GMP-binding protein [Thalassolituus]MAX87606.1 YajQ family cyclic di-GMP-binding protein [Oceanospirillaceae bacterium]MEC8907510.1 YajQ family cyclic di-GMP-binding protein [Pseudomonadota bacterium]HCG79488.1 YajQ family cyclic di-GMP-binding protein [Oceanospirillales bacterium]MEC9255966.1 YajQ family cyclic di-GMP-binding protein [Pseudomonadota bacterium]MEC9409807.1 YajQ family cyclic di-GMP-binding protein [Pseudomonadota bacterium]|tara:strand:- start:489 stop:974 length:486 start_codon:yes stop_codon:yes gene_type:complete